MQCYGQNLYYENHKYCDDMTPYFGDIDLDSISGVWYGVEKIPHGSKGEYRVEHTNECFYIEIKEIHVQVHFFTIYRYFNIFVVTSCCLCLIFEWYEYDTL